MRWILLNAAKKLLLAAAMIGLFLTGIAIFTAMLALVGGSTLSDIAHGMGNMVVTYLGYFTAGTTLLWFFLLARPSAKNR